MANNCARFGGKVAVLTASTDGIGLAIARRLGLEKAKIVVSSRCTENVTKAVESLRQEGIDAIGVKCHVAKPEDRAKLIQEAIKHYGGIDIFVSCAGVNPYIGPITECPESAFDKNFEINVKSSFLFTNEVMPHLKQRGGGSILFLSTNTIFRVVKEISIYTASKVCLSVLAKAYAETLAKDNIRVNCLASGAVDTVFLSKAKQTEAFIPYFQTILMERLGTVQEIAASAAFLLSSDASYVTGETLIVSGGMHSRI